ncbi:MAG: hypothetical protein R6U84_04500 [Candidatus Cloacimonadales bacterium]
MRILRNSEYWVAPTAVVGKYIQMRNAVKLSVSEDRDSYLVELASNLDPEIYDIPLTVAFQTDWEIVQILNSDSDGIYNPRNNIITLDLGINKKAIVKKIK